MFQTCDTTDILIQNAQVLILNFVEPNRKFYRALNFGFHSAVLNVFIL